jgi:hypothetical protein
MMKRIKDVTNKVIGSLKKKEIWVAVAYIVPIAMLLVSWSNLNTAKSQYEIAKSSLEATTRPYLSVENVTEKDVNDEVVSISIGVTNLGQLPATGVEITSIIMDKEQWIGTEYIETPTQTFTTEDNITITYGGIVVTLESPPEKRDFPSSIIFYPNKRNTFVMTVSRDKWERSVKVGSVIELKLDYSCANKDYWYIATSMLETNAEWKIVLERGN